jgi:hypothetical protein
MPNEINAPSRVVADGSQALGAVLVAYGIAQSSSTITISNSGGRYLALHHEQQFTE